jgi:hypothetical protein
MLLFYKDANMLNKIKLNKGRVISTPETFTLNTRFGKLVSPNDKVEDEDIILIAKMCENLFCWNYYAYQVLAALDNCAEVKEINSESLVIYDDFKNKNSEGKSALQIIQEEHGKQLALLDNFETKKLSSVIFPDTLDLIQAKYMIQDIESLSLVSGCTMQEIDISNRMTVEVKLGNLFIAKHKDAQYAWYVYAIDELSSSIQIKVFDIFKNFEVAQTLISEPLLEYQDL